MFLNAGIIHDDADACMPQEPHGMRDAAPASNKLSECPLRKLRHLDMWRHWHAQYEMVRESHAQSMTDNTSLESQPLNVGGLYVD